MFSGFHGFRLSRPGYLEMLQRWKILFRLEPHNVVHIKQLVRQHSHQIFSSLFLHLLRGRREVEPSQLQSDSRSSVHAARIVLNPRPPTSTHIESSALAVSPRRQMPLQTLTPSHFFSIRTKATPTTHTHLSMGPLCNCRGTLFTFCSAGLPRSFLGWYSHHLPAAVEGAHKLAQSETSRSIQRLRGQGPRSATAHTTKNSVLSTATLQPKQIFFFLAAIQGP